MDNGMKVNCICLAGRKPASIPAVAKATPSCNFYNLWIIYNEERFVRQVQLA